MRSIKETAVRDPIPPLPGQLSFLEVVEALPFSPLPSLPAISESGSVSAFDYASALESLEAYEQYCASQPLAEETAKTYLKCVGRFLEWWKKDSGKPSEPLTRTLADAYGDWLKEYSRAEQITEGRRAVILSSVRRWGTFLASSDLVPENPFGRVRGPEKPDELVIGYLSEEQVRNCLSTFPKDRLIDFRDYLMALLMLRTGIRETELCKANIEDIRPLGDLAFLNVRSKGKSNKNKEPVVLRPDVYAELQRYLAWREREEGGKQLLPEAPLLAKHRCRTDYRMTPHEIRRRLKPVFQARLMALRQTAALHALMNGAPLDGVQEMMRHESIETTKLYKKIANRIQRGGERFLDHLQANRSGEGRRAISSST